MRAPAARAPAGSCSMLHTCGPAGSGWADWRCSSSRACRRAGACRRRSDRSCSARSWRASRGGRCSSVRLPSDWASGSARSLGWSWPFHLTESSYGLVLAVKLAALAAVAAMGAYNWRVVQPALARPEGEERIGRSAGLELLFGLLLLAATAVLVALPFPDEAM